MSPQITLALAFMDYKKTIKAIQDRAAAIRLPWRDLCAAADVHISTLYRWQQDDANPRMRDLNRALDTLTAELERREADLLEHLLALHPDREAA